MIRDRLYAVLSLTLLCAIVLFLASCHGDQPPLPPPAPPPPAPTPAPSSPAMAERVRRDIPAFPWPPPPASAQHTIPNKLLVLKGEHTTLSDIGGQLEAALQDAKYQKWSYSSVPRGFALVAQLEQIKPDGTPRPDPGRFSTDLPSFSDLSFVEFLKALAKAPPGSYRVIVFIITDAPWSQSGEKPTEKQAQQWLNAGVNRLPESIGLLTYRRSYTTTALIYEFEKYSQKNPATLVPNSDKSGKIHLEKAGIWDPLTR